MFRPFLGTLVERWAAGVLGIFVGFLSTGCADTSKSAQSRVQILNGEFVDAKSAIAAQTVALTNARGSVFCSGTLIGKETVVTAAHCGESARFYGREIFIVFGVDTNASFFGPNKAKFVRQIRRFWIHSAYQDLPGSGRTSIRQEYEDRAEVYLKKVDETVHSRIKNHGLQDDLTERLAIQEERFRAFQAEFVAADFKQRHHDIALVQFDPLPKDTLTPATLASKDVPMEPGDPLVVAGLGGRSADFSRILLNGAFSLVGILKKILVKFARSSEDNWIFYSFASTKPLQGALKGDSGGPSFFTNSRGKTYLVGVTKSGLPSGSRFVFINSSTDLRYYDAWIRCNVSGIESDSPPHNERLCRRFKNQWVDAFTVYPYQDKAQHELGENPLIHL